MLCIFHVEANDQFQCGFQLSISDLPLLRDWLNNCMPIFQSIMSLLHTFSHWSMRGLLWVPIAVSLVFILQNSIESCSLKTIVSDVVVIL